MRVISDIETNGLDPSIVWCVVCKDIDTGERYVFVRENTVDGRCSLRDFNSFAENVTEWIGHFYLSYDAPVLNRICGTKISVSQITDTLIMSRLFNPERKAHGLKYWGEVLGYPKIEHEDWSQFSEEMLERCIQDVEINHKVYDALLIEGKDFSQQSIRIEHEVAHYINQMMQNGVGFDEKKSQLLHAEISEIATELERNIKETFKGEDVLDKHVIPKVKANGELSRVGVTEEEYERLLLDGEPYLPFDRYRWLDFNLDSPKQLVGRLNKIGWKPYIQTKGAQEADGKLYRKIITQKQHDARMEFGWKICEQNLNTIPEDAPQEYKNLAMWKMLVAKERWLRKQCWPNIRDGRIYGRCNSLGAVTGRMTHDNPNLANISRVKYDKDGPVLGIEGKFGYESRELYRANEDDRVLVGSDASGLELRCLAHDMKDKAFTEAVIHGKQEDGTDIHSRNRDILIKYSDDRDTIKTFIYALIFGAFPFRLGGILGGDESVGRKARNMFMRNMPKFAALERRIKAEAKTKRLRGLDGRYLRVRKNYSALNTRIQSSGAIVCKYWMCFIMRKINKLKLDAKLVLNVHDELQFDCHVDCAEEVGLICKEEMIKVGRYLKMSVPLEAEYKVGKVWARTH